MNGNVVFDAVDSRLLPRNSDQSLVIEVTFGEGSSYRKLEVTQELTSLSFLRYDATKDDYVTEEVRGYKAAVSAEDAPLVGLCAKRK